MRDGRTRSRMEGRPPGGPLSHVATAAPHSVARDTAASRRRRPARFGAFVLLAVLAGCGGSREGRPLSAAEEVPGRPLETFHRAGLITGSDRFPAVGAFRFLAGPADSTWVLFGLSMPAEALRFHRAADGFVAGYSVRLRFLRGGTTAHEARHQEQVRVATFRETGRTEESIFFQDAALLPPGRYVVEVTARDSIGGRGLARSDSLDVPAFPSVPSRLAALLVHHAGGRDSLGRPPDALLNVRHSVAYGSATPRLYLEAYDATPDLTVYVEVHERDSVVLRRPVVLAGGSDDVRFASYELPVDSLPLGEFTVVVTGGARADSPPLPLLVTISDQWMVANFEQVVDYLAYIASADEIERLRAAATTSERRAAWEAFWQRRDPVPASPVNEYREEFFERVRIAAEQFREPGVPGWRTHRGEVYIVLGEPDRVTRGQADRRDLAGAYDVIEWSYDSRRGGGLDLLFVDRDGFGRYRLTRSSEMQFRTLADRLRSRDD